MKNYLLGKALRLFWLLFSLWVVGSVSYAQSTIPALKRALAQAKTDTTRSRLLCELGHQYSREHIDTSFYFLNQSWRIAKRACDSVGMTRVFCQLSYNNLYYLKDESKALIWANKALVIARLKRNHLYMAQSFGILAVIALHQRIGNSRELLDTALFHAQQSKNPEIIGNHYAVKAGLALQQKQYTQATSLIQKSMEVFESYNTDMWFTAALDYHDILAEQGKHEQMQLIAHKLSLAKVKLQKTDGEFVYNNDVARLAIILKHYSEAESILLNGIQTEYKRDKADTLRLFHYYRTLLNVYEQQGNYQKALQASKSLGDTRLWLQRVRQTRESKLQMTELKAALAMQRKEREISALNAQQQQQQLYLIGFGSISALLIGFMVLIQRSKRRTERQRTELAQLNATQTKLFAILSHDLRAPVASLGGHLKLIDWGALDSHEFAQQVPGLHRQLDNVNMVLENTLNWSLSQMNGLRPAIGRVMLSQLVADLFHLSEGIAKSKNIHLNAHISPKATLLVDPYHLVIILRNLLQNAIKFTKSGGSVAVSYTELAGKGTITITDTGTGMSPDRLAVLFSPNRQSSARGIDGEIGTGLGLVLVEELVTANKGQISVVSEVDKGTTFQLIFSSVPTNSSRFATGEAGVGVVFQRKDPTFVP